MEYNGGRTETGTKTGTDREGRRRRNGTGNRKKGGKREQKGNQGLETKMCLLVEGVSEYREFYKGEGADKVRHLQYS